MIALLILLLTHAHPPPTIETVSEEVRHARPLLLRLGK